MQTQRGAPPGVPSWIVLLAMTRPLAACGVDNEGSRRPESKDTKLTMQQPAATPRPGDQELSLTWKGKKRVYTVHAPPGYSPTRSLPLVVAMHPYPSSGDHVAKLSRLNEKADQEDFLVAYPEGIGGGYNALTCCGSEDDVGFVRAMMQTLISTWKADPSRIYATGISNGADMAYKLAVELPGTFAAIAPVSGGYAGAATKNRSYIPKTAVSLITFIGGADAYYASFDQGIKTWQQRLACAESTPERLENQITKTAARCRDGSEVVAYRLPNMGHKWPGATVGPMADSAAGIDATDVMWAFFEGHAKKKAP